jgi:hypothetical protein
VLDGVADDLLAVADGPWVGEAGEEGSPGDLCHERIVAGHRLDDGLEVEVRHQVVVVGPSLRREVGAGVGKQQPGLHARIRSRSWP